MQISVEHLTFAYTPGSPVLRDLSFTVRPGERIALLGRNGCGKTTLARHLNGLLRPQQGRVRIGEVTTEEQSVAAMARHVALLFQNPDDQLCRRTVWSEVAFGAQNLGHPPEQVEQLVNRSLAQLDLAHLRDVNPCDLGWSQRKAVALASVLAMETPVVVLDEPTAGLAGKERERLVTVLQQLSSEGRSVLMISHDMDFVAKNFPRTLCLNEGRIAFDGEIGQAFYTEELVTACGLELPQLVELSRRCGLATPAMTPEQLLARLKERQLTSAAP